MKLARLRELRKLQRRMADRARAAAVRWQTPGAMAKTLDPRTVQTPALDLIDKALGDVAEGRVRRLIISVPPQEGKVSGSAAVSLCGC